MASVPAGSSYVILEFSTASARLIVLVTPLKVMPSSLPPDQVPSSLRVPPRYSLVLTYMVR